MSKGRILWRIAKEGEETTEEIKKWLIDSCKCKYYVLVDSSKKIEKDFVKDCLKRIKKLEDSVASIKSAGIVVSKNQLSQESKIQEPEIISSEPLTIEK